MKTRFRRIILLCNFVVFSLSLISYTLRKVLQFLCLCLCFRCGDVRLFHQAGPHTVLLGPLSDPVNITGSGLIRLVFIYQEAQ